LSLVQTGAGRRVVGRSAGTHAFLFSAENAVEPWSG
jgi:hypothetical protein